MSFEVWKQVKLEDRMEEELDEKFVQLRMALDKLYTFGVKQEHHGRMNNGE